MDCDPIEREGLTEAYLAGRLLPEEKRAFEDHAFGCPSCLEKLQALGSIQAELWEQGSPVPSTAARRRPALAWRWTFASASALLLVAAGAFLLWRPGRLADGPGPASRSRALAALGQFEAPSYLPASLRAGEGEAQERFRLGMEQYQAGRYERAIGELTVAERLDPGSPQIAFFLGVCHLLEGEIDQGIERLEKAISLGNTPYLLEARFYLAKGFLRRGDAEPATSQLKAVATSRSPLAQDAARLLTEIGALNPR
jgi:tetratricopeptide (TPR) repeat protein